MKTFAWLLKREYWEHRGGFLWAPVITCSVLLFMVLVGMVIAEAALRMHINDVHINIGVPLSQLAGAMTPQQVAQFEFGLGASMLGFGSIVGIVLGFVLFFYLLGALYNDRSDRSVLFWKSLPISDRDTVLSKVATATVVAPLIAFAALIAMQIGIVVLLSLFVLLHGGNPFALVLGAPALPLMFVKMLLALPLNALWMLPTVGWLLACSAATRSKPFLWALLLPVMLGALNGVSGLMGMPSLSARIMWDDGVLRLIGSTFQGWVTLLPLGVPGAGFDPLRQQVLDFGQIAYAYMAPELWIGAVIGIALIAAAVWFRRHASDL